MPAISKCCAHVVVRSLYAVSGSDHNAPTPFHRPRDHASSTSAGIIAATVGKVPPWRLRPTHLHIQLHRHKQYLQIILNALECPSSVGKHSGSWRSLS